MTLKKIIAIFAALCLAQAENFFAENKTIVLGGKTGWPKDFSFESGIVRGLGRYGYECVELSTNACEALEGQTDLLLNFEGGKFEDAAGNYKVQKNSLLTTTKSVIGRGAALSRGNGGGISLKGKAGSVFGTSGGCGSFSMEFWLCPATAENGEVVFEWHSSRIAEKSLVEKSVQYQKIEFVFFNNRPLWIFTNLFDGYEKSDGEIRLAGGKMLIPDKWSRHEISYDEESGLLEYRIDGRVENLKYITESGREGDTIFQPVLGNPCEINICPSYTGCIDEFKISRVITDSSDPKNLNYEHFKITGGRFETKPILTQPASLITSVSVLDNVPPQTEIRYYVRACDNYFAFKKDEPKWVLVENGQDVFGVQGRYFQVAAELFPDGGGRKTPSVTEIKINYIETPLPAAPLRVKAMGGDSSVSLSWNYSVDENAGGYYIYYGNRPGEYLGSDAEQGPSPIKVKNISSFNLTGLKNGAIYYFAVSAYSNLDDRICGTLSDETYARPGRR